jgi:hypothetical protein
VVPATALNPGEKGTQKIQAGMITQRVDSDDESTFLPPAGRLTTERVPLEVKVICQPQGILLKTVKNYCYRSEKPFSTRIYILDSGVSETSEVILLWVTTFDC